MGVSGLLPLACLCDVAADEKYNHVDLLLCSFSIVEAYHVKIFLTKQPMLFMKEKNMGVHYCFCAE